MNKKVLIGLGLALVGIEYRRFSSLMDSVSASTRNLQLSMQGGKIVVKFQLEITNNSSKDIDVKNISGEVFVGDKFLASYRTTAQQVVNANSRNTLPVTAILSDSDLAESLASFNLQTSTITLKTNATINFKVLGLIEMPIKIKDETSLEASSTIRDLQTYLKKWVDLFKVPATG